MDSRIDGAHHLRSTLRYKVFQPTEMTVSGATRRVHILNISTGGALIYAAAPPPIGSSVRLSCCARSLAARVAWQTQRRFGLVFSTPLSEADVHLVIFAEEAAVAAASQRLAGEAELLSLR